LQVLGKGGHGNSLAGFGRAVHRVSPAGRYWLNRNSLVLIKAQRMFS